MSFIESVFDERHYNIYHKRNRIFINVLKTKILYRQNTTSRPPHVKFHFMLGHQLAPNDLPRISRDDGFKLYVAHQNFSQPLRIFDTHEHARQAFKTMLARFKVPFEFRPEFGEIIHCTDDFYQAGNYPIQGFDDVVDRISKAGVNILREALAEAEEVKRGVKSIEILVFVVKRTVVNSEWFRLMEALEEFERLNERFRAAVEMLEMVRCDGDGDLECSICLNEDLVGTQVAMLPCSHKFHDDCIVTWFRNSQTCPLCRSKVAESIDFD